MSNTAVMKDFLTHISPVAGDIGLELEVEAIGYLPSVNSTWWQTKSEPSLRGGLEYTTKGALPLDALMLDRIKTLTDVIDTKDTQVVKDSHRTSVHVHHNIIDYTPTKLWTAITAYWLLENILFKGCGEERIGNHFCLRLKDAQAILLRYVLDDIQDRGNPFFSLDTDTLRYAGLNLNAIYRFGSVELRGMKGTVDPQIINDWATLTNGILHKATKAFSTPEDLLDFYFHTGWEKTVDYLWTNTKSFDYLLKDKEIGELIESNGYILSNVMYAPSWEQYTKMMDTKAELLKKKEPKSKKKNIDFFTDDPVNWAEMVPLSSVPMNFTIPNPRGTLIN